MHGDEHGAFSILFFDRTNVLNGRRTERWIVVMTLAATAALARGDIIDRIAASVGNRVITTSDLDREIRVTAFLNGIKPDFTATAKRGVLDRLVEQKLIHNELESARYPVPAAAEVEPELADFKKKFFPDEAGYQQALANAGISDQDMRDELLWQRTLLLFIDVRFRPGVQVTDQEIQDYFDKTVAPAARLAHPTETPKLEEYRDQIEQTLVGQKVERDMDTWLQAARRRTQIVFHQEAIQ
jgi:peptidyl-prolyl cis-trans isomerase SurA